jgi:hypothetical protein
MGDVGRLQNLENLTSSDGALFTYSLQRDCAELLVLLPFRQLCLQAELLGNYLLHLTEKQGDV